MPARILVVEDDEALRRAMVELLAGVGYVVEQAGDYRDALSALEDGGEVALLLTDLVLPGVNGFALGRMARMRHLGIKIVYMTAYETAGLREASGPVLRKPVGSQELLTTISATLGAD